MKTFFKSLSIACLIMLIFSIADSIFKEKSIWIILSHLIVITLFVSDVIKDWQK